SAGRPVPDHAAIHFNTGLLRYEFAAQIWDTANQRFVTDAKTGLPLWTYAFYNAYNAQQTVIDTRAGNDVVHADEKFQIDDPQFPGFDQIDADVSMPVYNLNGPPTGNITSGIQPSALPLNAFPTALVIDVGVGNDQVFGGPERDFIQGGDGADSIYGG